MNFTLGIQPDLLNCNLVDDELRLHNPSTHPFANLQLTISFEDAKGNYLDFEELDLEVLKVNEERLVQLSLSPPENAIAGIIDITGSEQTFLKRHWKLICTIVAISWGLIVVARRLTP